MQDVTFRAVARPTLYGEPIPGCADTPLKATEDGRIRVEWVFANDVEVDGVSVVFTPTSSDESAPEIVVTLGDSAARGRRRFRAGETMVLTINRKEGR